MRYASSSYVTSNPRAIREELGLTQQEFWEAIGVTQSGGSRYEKKRLMPSLVTSLFRLVYVEKIDIWHIKKDDIAALEYLKSTDSALYETIKLTAKRAAELKRKRAEKK